MKKIIIFFSILCLSIGSYAQLDLSKFLNDVPELEVHFKLTYSELDTMDLSKCLTISEGEIKSIMGDFRAIKLQVEDSGKYYLFNKLSLDSTIGFLLITEWGAGVTGLRSRDLSIFVEDKSDSHEEYYYFFNTSLVNVLRYDNIVYVKSVKVNSIEDIEVTSGYLKDDSGMKFHESEVKNFEYRDGIFTYR
ncbi:MAG: hypothetical protein JKY48_06380 [Flavobacteriales bacterium]|nr:hypothetical protein [Flavobacteriales bacterium]